MKRLLDRMNRRARRTAVTADTGPESRFFSTMFEEAEDTPTRATWAARAGEVGAEPLERAGGLALFAKLWGNDRHVMALSADSLQRLARYVDFVKVGADKEVIGQDELGDFMLIVLEGTLAVDRIHPWGGRVRLAEAHAGDMLGEMSLLDAGARFSSCRSLTPCSLAVIDVQGLDAMMDADAKLGAALLASLSRRLSLRLRKVSARLSALLSQD